MAKKTTLVAQEYHKSETYKKADTETRRSLERYKADQKISDEQMNWLMYLEDIRGLPKEERQKGNRPAEMLVLSAMVMFLLMATAGSRGAMLVTSIFFIIAAVTYLSGILNPYSVTIRKIKKKLKSYPKVKSYKEWSKPATEEKDD